MRGYNDMNNEFLGQQKFINKSSGVIEMLVDEGVSYNIAVAMNKWVYKKTNMTKMVFDLQAITGSKNKALELVNKACMIHHCVPYR